MVYNPLKRFFGYLQEISAETALDQIAKLCPDRYETLLKRYEREGEKPFRDSGWPTELVNALEGRVAARTQRKELEQLEGKVEA